MGRGWWDFLLCCQLLKEGLVLKTGNSACGVGPPVCELEGMDMRTVYVRRSCLDAHSTNNYEGAVSSGSCFVCIRHVKWRYVWYIALGLAFHKAEIMGKCWKQTMLRLIAVVWCYSHVSSPCSCLSRGEKRLRIDRYSVGKEQTWNWKGIQNHNWNVTFSWHENE